MHRYRWLERLAECIRVEDRERSPNFYIFYFMFGRRWFYARKRNGDSMESSNGDYLSGFSEYPSKQHRIAHVVIAEREDMQRRRCAVGVTSDIRF